MANFEYDMLPNESIIMKNEHVNRGNVNGELLLTNLYLVHVTTKGFFTTTYNTQRYPINQIKVVHGQAQTSLGKEGDIEIHFVSGKETFRFWNNDTFFSEQKAEKEASRWIDAINRLAIGEDVGASAFVATPISEVEIIADAVGGVVDAFKGALGLQQKSVAESIERSIKKCSSCGAPISGAKGKTVRCSYCDIEQKI